MAGNYPDSPSWRMAYDRDGTQVYKMDGGNNITQLTSSQVTTLNNESDDTYTVISTNDSGYLVFIFPELRDLDAYAIQTSQQPNSGAVSVSTNTTNGLDGTWTQISSAAYGSYVTKPAYRNNIVSSTALGIKAVRFFGSTGPTSSFYVRGIQLYGEQIPGANPNRLEIWHPTLDQKVGPAHFDWGDVPRNSSGDKQFRVKNLSTNLTASSIRVAMEALSDTTPSVPAQHTLSTDGATFLPQVNIGNLGPGAISGILTMRRVTPSNATLSLWTFRLFAESSIWG